MSNILFYSWNDIESNIKDLKDFRGWVFFEMIMNYIFPFLFFSEWACEDNLSMHMAPMWYQNGHLLRHGTTCEKQTPHVSESSPKTGHFISIQFTTFWVEKSPIYSNIRWFHPNEEQCLKRIVHYFISVYTF